MQKEKKWCIMLFQNYILKIIKSYFHDYDNITDAEKKKKDP